MAKVKEIRSAGKADEERQAITGMVIDAAFLRQIQPITDLEYFRLPYARIVAGWCLEYFEQYQEAPGRQIEDIFKAKNRTGAIDEQDSKLISRFLESISDEYERGEKRSTEYLARCTERFYRLRALRALREEIALHEAAGNVEAAEEALARHKSPQRGGVNHVNPFTDEAGLLEAFTKSVEPLFRLPGVLGEAWNGQLLRDSFIGVMGPEKRGKCLCGQTPVLLADGRVKPIREVVRDKDPEIMSLNEKTMKIVPMKVFDYWTNGKKSCVTVKTRTGRIITTTKNHPYLTPTGWKQVLELNEGDRIAVPRNLSCFGDKEEAKEKIELLALMIAEGGMTGNSCPSFTSSYSDVQDMFFKCVQHMGDGISRSLSDPITFSIINHETKKGKHNSNSTTAWLRSLDLMEKKSRDKKIPSFVFELKKHLLSLFLNVLFSCDGSVYKKGIEYSSASEAMIRQVSHLLLRFGIVGTVRSSIMFEKTYWSFEIRDRDNLLRFIDEIGFSFHKKEKAEELREILMKQSRGNCFIDSTPPEICDKIRAELSGKNKGGQKEALRAACANRKNLSRNSVTELAGCGSAEADKAANGDILWDSIVEIVDAGEIETFDLSVPEHHNFIAGDIVAHNTWTLMYLSLMAARSSCNVVFFAIGDMTKPQMELRFAIMNTGRSNRAKYCKEKLVPRLDCHWNQIGECNRKERLGSGDLLKDLKPKEKPQFKGYDEEPDWIPCTKCRRADQEERQNWKGAAWMRVKPAVEPLTFQEAVKAGKEFNKRVLAGKSFRLECYSRGAINVKGMRAVLSTWEANDGFVPDVVVIDYADNLGPEDGRKEFRHQQNESWGAMRALSQDFNCLVITATQADAASYNVETLNESNFSEDKRKYSHVTAIATLNQRPEEKRRGLLRVGQMFLREDDFDSAATVTLLQDLSSGQPVLASFK